MEGVQHVEKPTIILLDQPDNVYHAIGLIASELEINGLIEKAREFVHRSMPLSTVGEILVLGQDYVKFHHGGQSEPEAQ